MLKETMRGIARVRPDSSMNQELQHFPIYSAWQKKTTEVQRQNYNKYTVNNINNNNFNSGRFACILVKRNWVKLSLTSKEIMYV